MAFSQNEYFDFLTIARLLITAKKLPIDAGVWKVSHSLVISDSSK
jgi:hypothetical protein